ncbi:hypothetical protein RvY_12171 [Ramazzottius varieornatus]|uniref:L-Fucosyltransferase n=1 Tax=Ramazzottius varieornatus TaxID=947166 RepID=A0A1D1VIL9_RAMVA|nr:hypothetical protein RvY_12171 [Ramazzottius varieornatus]
MDGRDRGSSLPRLSDALSSTTDATSKTAALEEWNIFRSNCVCSPPTTTLSPATPAYISHNFHPKVGIGNLMFMYASLWGIAKKNGLRPTIKHTKLHDVFHLDLPPEDFFDLSDCNNLVLGIDEGCLYDNRTERISETAKGKNVSLWGYLQSWRYFHPQYEGDIRRQFAFKEDIDSHADQIIQEFRSRSGDSSKKRPTVGIHIRRGDVMSNGWQKWGFTVASREYVSHAMEYLKSKGVVDPIYIVCTNDVEWSRQNLLGVDLHFVENQTSYVDMAVLTKMDHLILSVGTFSFFAGYLSSAPNVIYYKRWPEPGSDFAKWMDLSSFWLPEWIAME